MGRLDRELRQLSVSERAMLEVLLTKLEAGEFDTLQIKKLKGSRSMYRVRIGKLRIIYAMVGNQIQLFAVRKRDENTYRDL